MGRKKAASTRSRVRTQEVTRPGSPESAAVVRVRQAHDRLRELLRQRPMELAPEEDRESRARWDAIGPRPETARWQQRVGAAHATLETAARDVGLDAAALKRALQARNNRAALIHLDALFIAGEPAAMAEIRAELESRSKDSGPLSTQERFMLSCAVLHGELETPLSWENEERVGRVTTLLDAIIEDASMMPGSYAYQLSVMLGIDLLIETGDPTTDAAREQARATIRKDLQAVVATEYVRARGCTDHGAVAGEPEGLESNGHEGAAAAAPAREHGQSKDVEPPLNRRPALSISGLKKKLDGDHERVALLQDAVADGGWFGYKLYAKRTGRTAALWYRRFVELGLFEEDPSRHHNRWRASARARSVLAAIRKSRGSS